MIDVDVGLQFEGFVPKNNNHSFPIVMASKPDTRCTLAEYQSICNLNNAEQKFEATKGDKYLKIINDKKKQLHEYEACHDQITRYTNTNTAAYLCARKKSTTEKPPNPKPRKKPTRSNPNSTTIQQNPRLASSKTPAEPDFGTLDPSLMRPENGPQAVNAVPDVAVGRSPQPERIPAGIQPGPGMVNAQGRTGQLWSLKKKKKKKRSTGITLGELNGRSRSRRLRRTGNYKAYSLGYRTVPRLGTRGQTVSIFWRLWGMGY